MSRAAELNNKAQKAIRALREPDASLDRVPNTVRQSIADIIEEQRQQIDKYGLTLMMIREGCTEPAKLAGEALSAALSR